jgi:hypothetical protein
MATPVRIISFDLGNIFTGCVVGEFVCGQPYTVLKMRVIEDKSKNGTKLWEFVKQVIQENETMKTVVIYENTYMFRNWRLQSMQKKLKAICDKNGLQTKALLPSQKFSITSGNNRKRKQSSLETSKRVLEGTEWKSILTELPRAHDVADAFLMFLYIVHHPNCIEPKAKKNEVISGGC